MIIHGTIFVAPSCLGIRIRILTCSSILLDQQIYYTVNQTLNDAFEVGSTCTNS